MTIRATEPPQVDLTTCDREPIHIPGSIQPHGCLLACDISASFVLRHSANCADLLGIDGDINGRKLDALLGEEAVHTIRNALTRLDDGSRPVLLFNLENATGRTFDIAVHRYRSVAIIEFEPSLDGNSPPLDLAREMIGRISSINAVDHLLQVTSRLVQGLFNYDRAMVYQLMHDGAGKVVSESKQPHLESFLGQYFPASDIPQQARQLYLRNTIRIISDANFERIPVVPVLDASGEPLDLSFAHLRSVSPIHCEYLRNMGVGASMSISIIVDGALWGLIACHHYAPRTLSMAERVAAEMFGQFFSLHLNALRQANKLQFATRARQSLDRFLRINARVSNLDDAIFDNLPDFASLMPCDGAAIWLKGKSRSIGSVPPASGIAALARLANKLTEGSVWATHMLASHLPRAENFAAAAAGVLIVPLSHRPRDYLFFFRKEVVQTLNWAGNPDKSYETGPLGDRLTPRKSFAIWKETVRQQSSPWTDEDREIAEATRTVLAEVALSHSELLEEERQKADVRQRMLNEELNHRVKNILAVIKSLINVPGQDGQSIETYVESLRGRIQALAFAHDQVVRGDGGGSLIDLIHAELTPYRDQSLNLDIDGPPVWLDARAFSVMALLLHELSTNAAKYGSLSQKGGLLTMRWTCNDTDGCIINWMESGGPPVKPPARQGFGTVLIDRSISYDLGGESEVTYHPAGLRATFRIPSRHASLDTRAQTASAPRANVAHQSHSDFDDLHVLIVEDEMLIAINLEQILLDAGVSEITTASSASDALQKIRYAQPNVAILDVNLGHETSVAVAEELKRRNIPFMLTTGYGDRSGLVEQFSTVPILNKPYEAAALIAELSMIASGKI